MTRILEDMLMNDAPRLFVHGVTTEAWIARYGIEPFSYPCYVCGRSLTTTRPFAQGTLRGLQAPTCECGDELTPFVIVRDPRYGDLFTGAEAGIERGIARRGKPLKAKAEKPKRGVR